MDWNQDRVVTAPVADPAEEDPQSDNALIGRFQAFFHDYPGESQNYPYRHEIEQRRAREDYWIELDLEDLRKAGDGNLVDEVKRSPAKYLPLVFSLLFCIHRFILFNIFCI